jgi:hypothetical protein
MLARYDDLARPNFSLCGWEQPPRLQDALSGLREIGQATKGMGVLQAEQYAQKTLAY